MRDSGNKNCSKKTLQENPNVVMAQSPSSKNASRPKPEFRRCTIDLTPRASDEVERIKMMFGITMADVFRLSLVLMRIYADAVAERKEVHVVDPKKPNLVRVIELGVLPHVK